MTTEERLMEIQASLGQNEEAHKSFKRRLDEHDAALKQQTDFLVSLKELTLKVGNVSEGVNRVEKKVNRIEERVDQMEKEPGDKWKKITWEVVKYLVIAAVGAVAAYFIKG